jgi:cytochrome c-type biogenesis protein CcmH/NrfG
MTDSRPDMSDVWQTLGDAYTRRNKLEQALSAYHNAENLLK